MFNQELTPSEPRPNLILFDLLHCYKKFIHAAGDHHWSRQNTRLVRTQLAKRNVQCKVHAVVYSMYNVTVIENAPGLVQCCLYWYIHLPILVQPPDWYLASPLRSVQRCNGQYNCRARFIGSNLSWPIQTFFLGSE